MLALSFSAFTYFVSPNGSDSNDGLSRTTAWRSLSRVSSAGLAAGDRVIFIGAGTYRGNLEIRSGGTAHNPAKIVSEGKPSTIVATKGPAIAIRTGGIELKNFVLKGAGKSEERSIGIALIGSKDRQFTHVKIDRVSVGGFGDDGIAINGQKDTPYGFDKVTITNAKVSGVYGTGISSEDGVAYLAKGYAHHDLRISDCDVSNNLGGNGIIISGVDGGLVEYCRAANNKKVPGQALGMWAWCAKRVTYRYCIASATRGTGDAGGFDLDGGTVECSVEKSLSFDNDGIGFMHCDYPSAPRTERNRIANSVSIDDGRRSKGGNVGFGYVVWGSGLYDCSIEGNVALVTKPFVGKQLNSALGATFIRDNKEELSNQRLENAEVSKNIVSVTAKGTAFVGVDFPKNVTRQMAFSGNAFMSPLHPVFLDNKEVFVDQMSWSRATGYQKNAVRRTVPSFAGYKDVQPRDLPQFLKHL